MPEEHPNPLPASAGPGPLPPATTQAWNLAQAMADFVADGCRTVAAATYQQRLAACEGCDRRRGNRCAVCGCRLTLKARGRAFRCPLGRWPATPAS